MQIHCASKTISGVKTACIVAALAILAMPGARAQTPADVILEAVPALPTALATDAGGNGYENKEYNVATTAMHSSRM